MNLRKLKPNMKGRKVKKKIVTVKKNVEANVGAAIFLLTNISPDRWRNKQTGTDVKTGRSNIEGRSIERRIG